MAKIPVDSRTLLKIQSQVEKLPGFMLRSELQKAVVQISKTPKHPLANFAAGMLQSRLGDLVQALEHLKIALKSAKSNEIILGAISFILANRLGHHKEALKYLRLKRAANRNDASTLLLMANSHLETGEIDQALGCLDLAEANYMDNPKFHGIRARCYLRSGKSSKARHSLEKIAELDPSGLLSVADLLADLPDNSDSDRINLKQTLEEGFANYYEEFRDDTHRATSAAALANLYEHDKRFDQA